MTARRGDDRANSYVRVLAPQRVTRPLTRIMPFLIQIVRTDAHFLCIIMETFYTGVLLVDRNFHAFTCRYTLETANIRILAWKQKAHHSWSDKLSPYMPRTLSLWKLKGDMIITKLTPQKELSEVLGKIDVNDMNTIEELGDHEKVANIGLSEDETLLLQVPGTSHISTIAGRVLIQV